MSVDVVVDRLARKKKKSEKPKIGAAPRRRCAEGGLCARGSGGGTCGRQEGVYNASDQRRQQRVWGYNPDGRW